MIRVVFVAGAVVLIWLLALQVIRFAKTRRIDWTGITFAIGFVVLAFYLREITGWG
jgi:hypothetical protein